MTDKQVKVNKLEEVINSINNLKQEVILELSELGNSGTISLEFLLETKEYLNSLATYYINKRINNDVSRNDRWLSI